MKTVFLIASAILPIWSPIVYIRSILRGESKPHRTTRFVYLATGILTTLALWHEHNTAAFLISAVSAAQSLVLFFFSFRYGVGGWSPTDIVCLIFSVTGMTLWQTTTNSFYGLYFGIAADFIGTIPTLIKTYNNPETENPTYYALDTLAGACNCVALSAWTIATTSYPLYLVFVNGLIAVLARRKKRSTTKSFVSPKVEIRNSPVNGVGMFAKKDIKKGEVVFIKGGHILTRKQVFSSGVINSYLPIDDTYVIGATSKEEEASIKLYNNHSCDPNCGVRGEITFVAKTHIRKGTELTIDYCMVDNEEYEFNCTCGSPHCRGKITGFDWKRKELQEKYKGYFARYLQDKIDKG